MAGKGFAPRPSHLKALEGCREDRLNRDEPIPTEATVVPPVELSPDAKAVWDRLAPDLIAKRVLTFWDVDLFACFCNSTAIYHRAVSEMNGQPLEVTGSRNQPAVHPAFRVAEKAEAMMRATGQRFGLTPGDRAQLRIDHRGGPKTGAEAYII